MGFPVWALPSCFLGGDHFPTSTFPGGDAGQMPRHRELWRKIPKIAGWGSYEEDKVGVILWSWTFGHCKIMQDHDRSPFFLFHWTQWSTSNSKPQQLKFGSMWDPPNKRGQRPAVPRVFFFRFQPESICLGIQDISWKVEIPMEYLDDLRGKIGVTNQHSIQHFQIPLRDVLRVIPPS